MKLKIFLLFGILTLLFGVLTFAQENTIAKVTFFQGTVQIKKDTLWTDVKLNIGLDEGDTIKTFENSRVEIKFADKGIIRIDQNSVLEIVELKEDEEGFVAKTKTLLGNIWSHVTSLSKDKDTFETSSPTAVAAVRGTVYRCDVGRDLTNIYVYKGRVAVQPWRMPAPKKKEGPGWGDVHEIEGPKEISVEEWLVLVKEMQKISVPAEGEKPEAEEFDPAKDEENEWVKWNKERDEQQFDDE